MQVIDQYKRAVRPQSFAFRGIVVYVIAALLFLLSFDLHIHTHEAAVTADHGSAISISALSVDPADSSANDEIAVDPDSALSSPGGDSLDFLVFIVLLCVISLLPKLLYLGRQGEHRPLWQPRRLYTVPLLRAPPRL